MIVNQTVLPLIQIKGPNNTPLATSRTFSIEFRPVCTCFSYPKILSGLESVSADMASVSE